MRAYLVFKKEETIKVIPDSVSMLAAIFNLAWVIYHRLWKLMILLLIYLSIIYSINNYGMINSVFSSLLMSFSLPYLWVYGNFWKQKALLDKGFIATDLIFAKNYDEAYYKALQ